MIASVLEKQITVLSLPWYNEIQFYPLEQSVVWQEIIKCTINVTYDILLLLIIKCWTINCNNSVSLVKVNYTVNKEFQNNYIAIKY